MHAVAFIRSSWRGSVIVTLDMRLILFVGLGIFATVEIHHDFYRLSQLKPALGSDDPILERNGATYGRGDGSVSLS